MKYTQVEWVTGDDLGDISILFREHINDIRNPRAGNGYLVHNMATRTFDS